MIEVANAIPPIPHILIKMRLSRISSVKLAADTYITTSLRPMEFKNLA